MGSLTPTYIEGIGVLAYASNLGGTEYKQASLDLKDHGSGPFDIVNLHIGYASGATPAAGLTGQVYVSSNGALDAAAKQYYAKHTPFNFEELTPTTVDQNSSGTTLYVAATTIFSVGDIVVIDQKDTNSEREWAEVVGIDAGVSLALKEALTNDPTAGNASTVQVWQTKVIIIHNQLLIDILLYNDDTDSGDDAAVQIEATARKGYTST